MKKKTQSINQDFKMPHLFREDLEEIEDIVKNLSLREYKFETKDFEYNSIQEIPKDVFEVNDFHIQMFDPYISVDFGKSGARIYSADDDIKTLGVIQKITDIIKKRERKLLWRLSWLSNIFSPLLIWTPIILLEFFSKETVKSNIILIAIATIVIWITAIVWFIIGYRAGLKKFSVIEFIYNKNKSYFFIRNKDQIIVGTILVIMTIILTLLFQKMIK